MKVHLRPSAVSNRRNTSENSCADLLKQYSEITTTKDILGQVYDVLSENIKSWQTFCSEDGDIEYFHTPGTYHSSKSERHTRLSLFATKRLVEGLEKCLGKVIALQKSCEQSAKDVKFRSSIQ